ncbi:MAG TPA: ABC transporter ATP-binding protein [Sumerlaeia bacterium]|nr:ABC transporter ATP-binding protein [Sumerlaeia bacterium]
MSENGHVVEIENVTRRFGSKTALEDVTLRVQRGGVFGLVGENGAGKTTLIKHVLGLFRAKTGRVRVFGMDPVRDPAGVLVKIGYLSEDRDLPDWMRVGELMRYTQAFYPNWDEAYAEELRETFRLDARDKIKNLSRGQRAQAGLLAALAHRPDLLVLDEPSSGLDPVVRRDILGAIIRTVADEGRTVLFSSHLLDEVERVSDVAAMIHEGRIVLCAPLDEIKARHRRLTLRFEEPQTPALPGLRGLLSSTGEGRNWTVVCDGDLDELRQGAASLGGRVVEEEAMTFEEIFVARVKGQCP